MKPKPTTVVKPILILTAIIFATTFSTKLHAQCGLGTQSVSYNISLIGTGNNAWGFAFPQFDPSVGTLMSVDIKAVISVGAKFIMQNEGSVQDDYTVTSTRNDTISVSALSVPITNTASVNKGPFTLQPGKDTVGAGTNASPKYFPLLSSHIINDSITSSIVGFLGTGYIIFDNTPKTTVEVTSGANSAIISSIGDTMQVYLTYYYCNSNILPQSITAFTVTKKSNELANLQWQTQNESWGNNYEIEESNDGKIFDSIGTVTSVVKDGDGTYVYGYPIIEGTQGILYFRLKEISADGNVKYSEIRSIDIENRSGVYVYPNPAADFINVVLGNASVNWNVSIFTSDGRLVQNNLFNSPTAHISFIHTLAKGVYFIRALNMQTKKITTLPFIVK